MSGEKTNPYASPKASHDKEADLTLKRPVGVSILAGLYLAASGFLAIVALMLVPIFLTPFLLAPCLWMLPTTWGMWKGRRWAWWSSVMLLFILEAMALANVRFGLGGSSEQVAAVATFLALVYMQGRNVRRYFSVSSKQRLVAVAVGVVAAVLVFWTGSSLHRRRLHRDADIIPVLSAPATIDRGAWKSGLRHANLDRTRKGAVMEPNWSELLSLSEITTNFGTHGSDRCLP